MGFFFAKVLWGILIILFGAVMISAFRINDRMMRKRRERGSIFSVSQSFRAMGTRDFYLFILLICIGALIVLAMRLLKELGI
jgi:hypothetical protein